MIEMIENMTGMIEKTEIITGPTPDLKHNLHYWPNVKILTDFQAQFAPNTPFINSHSTLLTIRTNRNNQCATARVWHYYFIPYKNIPLNKAHVIYFNLIFIFCSRYVSIIVCCGIFHGRSQSTHVSTRNKQPRQATPPDPRSGAHPSDPRNKQ